MSMPTQQYLFKLFINSVLIICFCQNSFGQKQSLGINIPYVKNLLNEESIYIVCRGTGSKGGMIARDYNLKDTLVSHIGIGLLFDKELIIFHVTDQVRSSENAFQIASIQSFIDVADNNFFSIWSYSATSNEVAIAKKNM
jgi:hypothetical protein